MKILLTQLPVPTLTAQAITGNYPLGAASMILHARSRGIDSPELLSQQCVDRAGDAAIVDELAWRDCDAVGFTCAVWNIERTMYIAGELRSRRPELTILLGGPEIASDCAFVSSGSAPYSYAFDGEGEAVLALLASGVAPQRIEGLLRPGGRKTAGNVHVSNIEDLSTVHDPFVSGLINMEHDGVAVVECSRGCSYGCTFCRYHRVGDRMCRMRPYTQIGEIISFVKRSGGREIFILDPSLEQRPDFHQFLRYLAQANTDPVVPLFVELRADKIGKEEASMLYDAGVRTVEAGLQTISREALLRIGRTTDMESLERGLSALQESGIQIRLDIMAGLPGDTPDGFLETCRYVKKLGLSHSVQVFRTQVLPGTPLRRIAERQGIIYEDRPPYLVVATPQWDAASMENAMFWAEDELDISLAPEHRPLLHATNWADSESIAPEFSNGTVWFYGFDLDKERGRTALKRELFNRSANPVTLWFRSKNHLRYADALLGTIDRFLTANPYVPVSIIIETAHGAPLDIFDLINENLSRNRRSRYLERLFQTMPRPHPERRLYAAISFDAVPETDAWLEDCREQADIIRIAPCSNIERIIDTIENATHQDFLFIDIEESLTIGNSFFNRLITHCTDLSMIILPGPRVHWEFLRFVERHDSSGLWL